MAHAHGHPIPHDLFTQEMPSSPTLTNPDMILPYRPRQTSSPSPLASSPLLRMHSIPERPDSGVSLNSSQPDLDQSVEFGVATAVRVPSQIVSPVDMSFGGYEHGAPLSDIGEEETPRSKRSRRIDSPVKPDPSSPTPAARDQRPAIRSRRSSSSDDSEIENWEDFDTSRIMNGRLAADIAKVSDDKLEDIDSKRNSAVATSTEDEMALLNDRAERILEQARKRLTNMEDNLSKARHMFARSSPNASDLHQPAGGLYRSISLAGASRKPRAVHHVVRANSTRDPTHSRTGSDTTPASGLKRLSMIAEARSASALEYGQKQESPQQYQSSPLTHFPGPSPASNRSYNSPLRALKEEQGTPSTTNTSPESLGPRGLGINNLAAMSREDVPLVASDSSTTAARSPSQVSTRSTKEIREQMSDLRNRIADLKEKAQADSLRRRSTQSLRTASPFMNPHTPEQWYTSAPEYKEGGSPLNTNAGMGWSPSQQTKRVEIQVTPVTPEAQRFLSIEQPATNESRLLSEAKTDRNTPSLHKSINMHPTQIDESRSVIQESNYQDAAEEFDEDEPVAQSEEEQIYLNEVLEESLQEIEPEIGPDLALSAEQNAGRHEDRLDAFDYENMFLHSALGNYAGKGTGSRTPSESDRSSVVTTRMDQNTPTVEDDDEEETQSTPNRNTGKRSSTPTPVQDTFPKSKPMSDSIAYLEAPSPPWMKTVRSNSMDSMSTVATFETATEGAGEEDLDEDELPNEILQWGNGINFPQPPTSPRHEMAPPTWPMVATSGSVPPTHSRSPRKMQSQGSVVTNGIPTPPTQSPSMTFTGSPSLVQLGKHARSHGKTIDHPANTEILMESLIKLADPEFSIAEAQGSETFSHINKDLVLDLLRAVGGVCDQILKAESQHETRAVKVLRRRLDESKKILEGHNDE
ncbi:hypothetical protein LTR10_011611 [Elasticomyces elasticus]|uniref:Uncharacterized protein n=1 Tax=Exophiala sideris TaxID=1016849 RepID=A0ABR0JCX9_9EURO|nr:hypothetical protein LTR10_011611 [Elasticomyces elasticus]KAK5031930.1 hypothetical protein LTS07_004551 [Exophiala sideris]KAK5040859.1 hypothetical protein LTR13_003160 [Exophiala sideris]KAK5061806.1 hypothetical protein LTR69_004989 [Exophiala sideris]KAK5184506.1 hypothetical protein LTR44_003180 [Eurotiomycetes sp. CCFEE 6388]